MWGIRWILLFGLWLALTDTRTPNELAAGVVVAAIGATVASLISRPGPPRTVASSAALLRLSPRQLARPLLRIVPDTGLLAGVLWRRLVRGEDSRGSLRLVPRDSDPALRSAAGRLLTEVWGSLAPNRYVIGVDEDRDTVLFHELASREAPLEPGGRR